MTTGNDVTQNTQIYVIKQKFYSVLCSSSPRASKCIHNTISYYHTCPSHPAEMRFRSAALLAALAIVPACAERLKIPNERPDINSTLEGDIIAGRDGGGGDGGVGGDVVIAS